MSNISHRILLIHLLYFIFWCFPVKSNEESIISVLCRSETNSCSDCLNLHPNCSWCYDLEFVFDRCDLHDKLSDLQCSSIYKGKKSSLVTKIDVDFRDVTETVKNAVQIRPQRVKLSLRPGTTKTIKLKYQIAKNYPLDLYYLMDASFSMKDDIETVAALGDHLTHSLSNLTKYFRIGFGTFSDKVLMPFARMDKESFENPCVGTNEQFCSPSYGFKHQFRLNNDVLAFIQKVNGTKVTANLDNAEGALDALMQVIVCSDHVSWQSDSRKLVLLLTNGLLHFAGDGKLAGISKRADGLCHLDETGFYDKAETQDYPSLEQIYRKLKKHKINVIFAVTDSVYNYYKKLNNLIPNFTYVTLLHSDSSNILNVIKQGYEETVSVVEFQDNSNYPLEIKYFSTCNKKLGKLTETNSCNGVKQGDKYEFDVKFSLKTCPEDSSLWKQNVVIDEIHLDTESLTIELEMLCGCNCGEIELNSSLCNFHGNLECGVCKCDNGWSGKYCDCDLSNFENDRSLENKCRQITDNFTSSMCYGNGDCICGKCECESFFTGKYCECLTCDRINGLECGGPSRGLCSCGTCLCMPGYTGKDCSCSLDESTCVAPGDTTICSGHGSCLCGSCECDTDPFQFSGQYCEKCSTCSGLCHLYSNCVKCSILNTCSANECDSKVVTSVQFVNDFPDESNKCLVFVDKELCPYWYFKYHFNADNSVNVEILQNSCEPTLSEAQIAGGVFILVVLLGLIVLAIIKFKNYREDKRIYAEYLKQLEMSKYNGNPLFVPAVTEYKMPNEANFS